MRWWDWNAVKIAGQWRLIDVTWAAGYVDAGGTRFSRKFNPGFFCTLLALFVQNHLPDDEAWQLLAQPLSKKAFAAQPLISYGQDQYAIVDFEPSGEAGNRVVVWLNFTKRPKVIGLVNHKGKRIAHEERLVGEKLLLSFSSSAGKRIDIFGGKSKRGRLYWLAT